MLLQSNIPVIDDWGVQALGRSYWNVDSNPEGVRATNAHEKPGLTWQPMRYTIC